MSRRYFVAENDSRALPYAIPYDGREVMLHWANKDQYYIKSSEYLANFTVDLAAALARLRADHGCLVAQAEGGATLNGMLAQADLIDELNLTISPQISGGDGARVTAGAGPLMQRMQLAHVLEDDGFLFTRYVRAR